MKYFFFFMEYKNIFDPKYIGANKIFFHEFQKTFQRTTSRELSYKENILKMF